MALNVENENTIDDQIQQGIDAGAYLEPQLAAFVRRDQILNGEVLADPYLVHLKTESGPTDPKDSSSSPQSDPKPIPLDTSNLPIVERRKLAREAAAKANKPESTAGAGQPVGSTAKDVSPNPVTPPAVSSEKPTVSGDQTPATQDKSRVPRRQLQRSAGKTPGNTNPSEKPQVTSEIPPTRPAMPPGSPDTTRLPSMGLPSPQLAPMSGMGGPARRPESSKLDQLKTKYPRIASLVDTAQMFTLFPLDTGHKMLDTFRSQRSSRKLAGSAEAIEIEDQRLKQVYQDALRNLGLMTKLLSDPEFADGVNQYTIARYGQPLDELPIEYRIQALTQAAGRLGAIDNIVPLIEENEKDLARDQIAIANLNSIMHDLATLGEISPQAISFAAKGMEALKIEMSIYPRYQQMMREYQIISHSTNLQNTWLVESGKMATRFGIPPAMVLQVISVTTQMWGDFAAAQPVTVSGLIVGGLYGFVTSAATLAAEQGLFVAATEGIAIPAILGAFALHTVRGLGLAAMKAWHYRNVVQEADEKTQGTHYTGLKGLKPPKDPHDTP